MMHNSYMSVFGVCLFIFLMKAVSSKQQSLNSEAINVAEEVKQFSGEFGDSPRLIVTYAKGSLNEKLDDDGGLKSLQKMMSGTGFKAIGDDEISAHPLKNLDITVFKLSNDTLSSENKISQVVDALLKESDVVAVEADSVLALPDDHYKLFSDAIKKSTGDLSSSRIPKDSYWGLLWGMLDINAPSAWDVVTGAEPGAYRPIVTVIDSGIQLTHPDLVGNLWVNKAEIDGIDGVDDDLNGFVDDFYGWNSAADNGVPEDDEGHGTHVAGTIGAVADNDLGVVGVSWGPLIQPCKFIKSSGYGSTSDAIKCLEYAIATKSDMTCNSWGGGSYSNALLSAIERANEIGQFFVTSAGNSANDNDIEPHYPSNYEVDNVIAVGAVNSTGHMSSFSNYGVETVDLLAPGSQISSTYIGSWYAHASGTSMACPHVVGALALMKSHRPHATMMELKDALLNSVVPYNGSGDVLTDGKLDLQAAISMLESTVPTTPPPVEQSTPPPVEQSTPPPVEQSTAAQSTAAQSTAAQSTAPPVQQTTPPAASETVYVSGSSSVSCVQICEDNGGLICSDAEMSMINTNLNYCFERAVLVNSRIKNQLYVSSFFAPYGCSIRVSTRTAYVKEPAPPVGCDVTISPYSSGSYNKICACMNE